MFLTILIIICQLGMFYCCICYHRIPLVRDELLKILELVSHKAKWDIKNDLPWKWRYEAFKKVSISKMIFEIWKPVESYFDNHICLINQK